MSANLILPTNSCVSNQQNHQNGFPFSVYESSLTCLRDLLFMYINYRFDMLVELRV